MGDDLRSKVTNMGDDLRKLEQEAGAMSHATDTVGSKFDVHMDLLIELKKLASTVESQTGGQVQSTVAVDPDLGQVQLAMTGPVGRKTDVISNKLLAWGKYSCCRLSLGSRHN